MCTYGISSYVSKILKDKKLNFRNHLVQIHELHETVKVSTTKVKDYVGVEDIAT
jgi:hypothetical protein